MTSIRILTFLYLCVLLISCGGGDGIGANSNSAISHHVPYLLGPPSVSYTASVSDPTKYDVTVTLQADGPTGVAFVELWIKDENDESNFAFLELLNSGNKTWTATTDTFIPLAPGNYYLESIMMHDSDPFSGVTRTGWYFTNTFTSENHYTVDERETDFDKTGFIFFNVGDSNIAVVRVTLP